MCIRDRHSIQVYDPERDVWEKLDYNKAYRTSFTFEASQNLVGLMEDTTRFWDASKVNEVR